MVGASADPVSEASQAAIIDEEYYSFCKLEAQNNVELVAEMGDMANEMISDGISESIAGQALEGAQAEACKEAWIETMAENGITYVDPGTASPEASPAAS